MSKSQQSLGQYATINGLRIYYEVHGSGQPVVLLHGGVGGIEMFGPNVAALARTRKVVAVDLEGRGFTADLDRPLRYEQMADDVAGLITQLALGTPDLLGYSLAGGVAFQIAVRHADVVRKLVLLSAAFARAAFYPEILQPFAGMGPDTGRFMAQSSLARSYPAKDWGRLFAKLGELQRRDYDWSDQVAAMSRYQSRSRASPAAADARGNCQRSEDKHEPASRYPGDRSTLNGLAVGHTQDRANMEHVSPLQQPQQAEEHRHHAQHDPREAPPVHDNLLGLPPQIGFNCASLPTATQTQFSLPKALYDAMLKGD